MTKLEYLYNKYQTTDTYILNCRCPINLKSINLYEEVDEEFMKKIDSIEISENIEIAKILDERLSLFKDNHNKIKKILDKYNS